MRQWINDFIAIATEMEPELQNNVIAGTAKIYMPADVLKTLKAKRITTTIGKENYFEYQSKGGAVLLKVVGTEPFISITLTLG